MTASNVTPLLVGIAIACVSLVGTVLTLLAAMPKTRADTIHVESQALAQLVAGFTQLSSAQRVRIDDLATLLKEANSRATLAGQYARRCEQLEAELKASKAGPI